MIFFWRDVMMPGVGLWLLLIDPGLRDIYAWQVPIVLVLLGTPVVARPVRPSRSMEAGSGDSPNGSVVPTDSERDSAP